MAATAPQQVLDRIRPETAWQPFFPGRNNRWDIEKVGHLYRRAAFAATETQIEQGVKSSPAELVEALLGRDDEEARFDADLASLRTGVLESNNPRQAQALWMHRLLSSPHPLRERMTLFWHDHFATSHAKVNRLPLMVQQIETLRQHSLGYFGELLQAMTRDPAMLIWLDSNTNRRGAPNENYAREIFELFSLGEGHYTERDIQEAARALTGWSVENDRAVFSPAHFDDGVKTLLGQSGRFSAGDVVRLALGQEACALFVIRKMFAEFVSESATPSDELLQPLADGFRQRNYDISWLMRTIFQSWVFYSSAAMYQRIKSPVEFVVGAVKLLEGRFSPLAAVDLCSRMGQSLLYPPSVKGWDGGDRWLNSTTLLLRQNFAYDLTSGQGQTKPCDPARLVWQHGVTDERGLAMFFLRRLHQQAPPHAIEQIAQSLAGEAGAAGGPVHQGAQRMVLARAAAHLAMTMPEFQLA